MNPDDIRPLSLMFELRERLVRIETKMDGVVEKAEAQQLAINDHAIRITAIEGEAAQLKSTIRTLKWLGSIIAATASFLGVDKLMQLFHST